MSIRARTAIDHGDQIVDARLAEERLAKEVLARLDDMSPDDPGFNSLSRQFRAAVLFHAEYEERESSPRAADPEPETLERMAPALRAAGAAAPIRPHPNVDTTTANLAASPVAAVVDRVRDAIRSVTDRG